MEFQTKYSKNMYIIFIYNIFNLDYVMKGEEWVLLDFMLGEDIKMIANFAAVLRLRL